MFFCLFFCNVEKSNIGPYLLTLNGQTYLLLCSIEQAFGCPFNFDLCDFELEFEVTKTFIIWTKKVETFIKNIFFCVPQKQKTAYEFGTT